MPIRKLLILTLLVSALARAQDPLNPSVPLVAPSIGRSPGQIAVSVDTARRAEDLGFPGIAATLYAQLESAPGADLRVLSLALATARLDEGRPDAALAVLASAPPPHGSAWHLRSGLARASLRQWTEARSDFSAVKPEELASEEKPWIYFLQGLIANSAGDTPDAAKAFLQAESLANANGNPLTRTRFLLAREQAGLRMDRVTEDETETAHKNSVNNPGSVGYDFARTYAVMLYALGVQAQGEARPAAGRTFADRQTQAINWLSAELKTLPPQERARADDFRLLIGLIGGADKEAGRTALFQLLETGSDPDLQREALQMLARAAGDGAARDALGAEIDKLVKAGTQQGIADELYLMQSQLALGARDFDRAQKVAGALLVKYPGSPLKAYALSVEVEAAWEQEHYRTAADLARDTYDALPLDGGAAAQGARARLRLLVAEARYRAKDYARSAEEYASVVGNPPPGVPLGEIMFQRVEAEIKAGELAKAGTILDEEGRSPQFDAVNRWKAEWNLARELQLENKSTEAYDRVNRLVSAAPAPNLPPELRARMAWLQARLAVDTHHDESALRMIGNLGGLVSGLNPALRDEIASSLLLLKARTCLQLPKREAEAFSLLEQLRKDYPRSDAAAASYLDESDYESAPGRDHLDKSLQLLTSLADSFKTSPYAPFALYQAACVAERIGQEQYRKQAIVLLEELITRYPNDDLVFDARLKEGDVFTELNQYPQAQRAYEADVNNPAYAGTPNVIVAQLALARCLNAQSQGNPNDGEQAINIFERLCYMEEAPPDVRVEAGFNLGLIYRRSGSLPKSATSDPRAVWYNAVVAKFLLDPARASELTDKGRYWMSKTLFELADLDWDQAKYEEEVAAYKLIVASKLPFASKAEEYLTNLNSHPSHP